MDASKEPDIFESLKIYLQDTYKLSTIETIMLIGRIESLIHKEVNEIKKNRNIQELNLDNIDLDDILDVDFINKEK